jgi:hypothetical protein
MQSYLVQMLCCSTSCRPHPDSHDASPKPAFLQDRGADRPENNVPKYVQVAQSQNTRHAGPWHTAPLTVLVLRLQCCELGHRMTGVSVGLT